jgi:hypothetical protein
MESRFAFTCCSKWNRGNGHDLRVSDYIHISYIGFSWLHIVVAWQFLPSVFAFFYSAENNPTGLWLRVIWRYLIRENRERFNHRLNEANLHLLLRLFYYVVIFCVKLLHETTVVGTCNWPRLLLETTPVGTCNWERFTSAYISRTVYAYVIYWKVEVTLFYSVRCWSVHSDFIRL